MRTFVLTLSLTVAVYLTGCTSRSAYPSILQQAERCMNIRPDSALRLLQSVTDSICIYPKETQMYWLLLTIQAKDKLYITHTSDSLINHIVKFYEKYNDDAKLMKAYYYQGRVYRDMNDAPKALKAFQHAKELKVPDWDLLTKIYSQMGYLFSYQGLYDEAIQINQKFVDFYTQLGKEHKASYAFRDIARMYNMKEEKDKALYYYKRAWQTALADKDSTRYYGILSEAAGLYYKAGLTDSAQQILMSTVNLPCIKNKAHIYTVLGDIYEERNCWDSAIYYRKKAIETGNIHKAYSNYTSLGWMEIKRGNEKEALAYLQEALWASDSIRKITETEGVAKINSLYNYQHTKAENNRLQLEQERYEKMLLLATLLILTAAKICVCLVINQKKERRKFRENEKRLKQLHEQANLENQKTIEANGKKIKELEAHLKDETKKKDEMEKQMTCLQVEQLKWQNQGIQLSLDKKELAIKTLKASEVYSLFKRVSLGEDLEIETKDWSNLRIEINKAYPNFLHNLLELYSHMSLVETRICLLTKIDIPPAHIARVLGYSRSSVTSARDRLYKKIFGVEGTAEKFTYFIENI